MMNRTPWTKKYWLAVLATTLVAWLVMAFLGPGADYIRCYTWMVMEPERLRQVAEKVWTLNPPWLAPFMAPFVALPGRAGYLAFIAASLAMIIYTARFFGGRAIPILLSAHTFWILWWGQIEGWGVLALVLGWVALERKSWGLMALAVTLASFKPQISFVPIMAMWWWMGRERWKSLLAFGLLFALSLLIWGPWPVWYLQGIFGFVGDQHHGPWNASLGLIALPLFIPAVLLPLNREKRLITLTATALVASPYLPYYSSIALLCFALPWWAYLFGLLGYLPSLIGTRLAWNGIVFLPILTLAWVYAPIIKAWVYQRRALHKEHSP